MFLKIYALDETQLCIIKRLAIIDKKLSISSVVIVWLSSEKELPVMDLY